MERQQALWKMRAELEVGETVKNVHLVGRNHEINKHKKGNKWHGRRTVVKPLGFVVDHT